VKGGRGTEEHLNSPKRSSNKRNRGWETKKKKIRRKYEMTGRRVAGGRNATHLNRHKRGGKKKKTKTEGMAGMIGKGGGEKKKKKGFKSCSRGKKGLSSFRKERKKPYAKKKKKGRDWAEKIGVRGADRT